MGIPKGWFDYHQVGCPVPGTKFLPFKVPLKMTSFQNLDDSSQWFTPAILLEQQPRLKAVVDLTNTTKFYNPEEFIKNGITYKKIEILGGGILPSRRKISNKL